MTTMDAETLAYRMLARKQKLGALVAHKGICAYAVFPSGLTYYYDWSLGELEIDCWFCLGR